MIFLIDVQGQFYEKLEYLIGKIINNRSVTDNETFPGMMLSNFELKPNN